VSFWPLLKIRRLRVADANTAPFYILKELSASSLAKCYHINSQSGVKNTKMALDATVEQTSRIPLTLECAKTTFISDYMNGTKVYAFG